MLMSSVSINVIPCDRISSVSFVKAEHMNTVQRTPKVCTVKLLKEARQI